MRTLPTLLAIALAGVTALAACGDDDDAGGGDTAATWRM